MARLVDLTAYKLERMLHENSHDEWLHQALLDILGDYYLGMIAVGWEDGNPVVMPLAGPTNPMGGAHVWNKGIPPGFSVVAHDMDSVVEKDYNIEDGDEDL